MLESKKNVLCTALRVHFVFSMTFAISVSCNQSLARAWMFVNANKLKDSLAPSE